MSEGKVIPLFGLPADSPAGTHRPYQLEPSFECALILRVCVSDVMWAKIGRYLDPMALAIPECCLALDAARAIAAETGRAPRGAADVLAYVARLHAEGKITIDAKAGVRRVLQIGNDVEEGALSDEMLVRHMRPLLQQALRRQAALRASEELTRRGDGTDVVALYEAARFVGQAPLGTTATGIDANTIVELARLSRIAVATTGILELDLELFGGLACGCLGMVMGATGSGKSMMLVHVAVANALLGRTVVYLTGELSVEKVKLRVLANLFGVPVRAIKTEREVQLALLEHMEEMTGWLKSKFRLHVDWFEPKIATPAHCAQAVERIEDHTGEPVHMVVVDYADKLRPDREPSRSDKGYAAAGDVYEALHLYAQGTRRWVWTASQANRGDRKRKHLDIDHVSDSLEKVRVCDLLVTLNPDANNEHAIQYYIAKNRDDEGRKFVGPLAHDFACARITAPADPTLYPSVQLPGRGPLS